MSIMQLVSSFFSFILQLRGVVLTSTLAFLISVEGYCQITITSDLVVPSDTVIYRGIDFYPDSTISLGTTGLNTWDFSSLTNESIDTIVLLDPVLTPYASKFPTANVCMANKDGYTYFNKTSTRLGLVGSALDFIGNGTLLAVKSYPELTFIPFNSTYLTAYAESVTFSEVLKAEDLNASSFDSIFVNGSLATDVTFDAYGTMIAPFDTMDVIRQKVVEVLDYTVIGKKYLAGQVLYTTLLVTETTTDTRYLWWSDSAGFNFPVAEMDVSSSGIVRSVQFAVAMNVKVVEDIVTACKDSCDAEAYVLGGLSSYTYTWSDPDTQVADTVKGLCTGSYHVKVADKNGSYVRLAFNVSNATEIEAWFAGHGATCETCTDGLTTAHISGGTAPYTVLWDSSADFQTTIIAQDLIPGPYAVFVEDDNGCPAYFDTKIGIFEGILIYPNPADESMGIFSRLGGTMIFEIYSLSGEKLREYEYIQKESSIGVKTLPEGHYLYRLLDQSGDKLKSGHFTILHP